MKQLTLYIPEGSIATGITIEYDGATSDVVAFRLAGSSLLIDLSGTAGLESGIRISAGYRLTVVIRMGD